VVRLLVAGLLCDLVWESLNFLAPQKWIYTVRGLEELKIFEMPVLGFLGFPALALDAFAAYAAIAYLFHANRTWEHPDEVSQRLEPRAPLATRAFAAMLPLHLVFWGVVERMSAPFSSSSSISRRSRLAARRPSRPKKFDVRGIFSQRSKSPADGIVSEKASSSPTTT